LEFSFFKETDVRRDESHLSAAPRENSSSLIINYHKISRNSIKEGDESKKKGALPIASRQDAILPTFRLV
jgi:hypothetical protein